MTALKETAMNAFSRRTLLKGAAAAAALPTLGRAQAAPRPQAVVVLHLVGGYNALFSSAQSFVGAGSFGASAGTVTELGNGLSVDAPTLGTHLPPAALSRIATLGVNHHLSSHTSAQLALWTHDNGRSSPLRLAAAMAPTPASLPCVVVGGGTPAGTHLPESGVSLQRVGDLGRALDLFGVNPSPLIDRRSALGALQAAKAQSAARFTSAPNSSRSAREAYDGAAQVLGGAPAMLDYPTISAAYGVTGTAVSNITQQLLAAEVMIRLGTRVVIATDGGWDTHGDLNGTTVRNQMSARILPPLTTFLSRMLGPTSPADVTLAIVGDFARSLPGSDHASCLAPTIIGPRVKVGSTGNVDANVGMADGVPDVKGLWSYLADAARVSPAANPFGANPHASLLLP
jgi:hypothetical protein